MVLSLCVGHEDGRWFVLRLWRDELVKVYYYDKGFDTLAEALQVMLALQNKKVVQ
jgi:hypothetical protein